MKVGKPLLRHMSLDEFSQVDLVHSFKYAQKFTFVSWMSCLIAPAASKNIA